jgi:hypothetical protein
MGISSSSIAICYKRLQHHELLLRKFTEKIFGVCDLNNVIVMEIIVGAQGLRPSYLAPFLPRAVPAN